VPRIVERQLWERPVLRVDGKLEGVRREDASERDTRERTDIRVLARTPPLEECEPRFGWQVRLIQLDVEQCGPGLHRVVRALLVLCTREAEQCFLRAVERASSRRSRLKRPDEAPAIGDVHLDLVERGGREVAAKLPRDRGRPMCGRKLERGP